MKIDLKTLVPQERLDALGKSRGVARLDELLSKVKSGRATVAERRELSRKTEWVRKMPKNVLSEDHRPAALDSVRP